MSHATPNRPATASLADSASRRFIVGNEGKDVVIREVMPESCAFTLDRRGAWEIAKRRVKPKRVKDEPGRIFFQDLAGFRTDVTGRSN